MGEALDRLYKLHSRLRCVANGRADVNAVRAQQNGAVRVVAGAAKMDVPTLLAATEVDGADLSKIKRGAKQKRLPSDVEVNVFVLLKRETSPTPALVTRRSGRVGSATIKLSELSQLDELADVDSIELAETLQAPDPRLGTTVPPKPEGRHAAFNLQVIKGRDGKPRPIGSNVLVGIIDVGGIDFTHPDFMDASGKRSRIVSIWDQGGDTFDPPQLPVEDGEPPMTSYGSEIKAEDIAFAMSEAAAAKVSPHDLAPQWQSVPGSHATHVASIAAGRTGLCQNAKIAAVMVALPDEDGDRRRSFYDTTRIVDGISYLFAVAEREKVDAVSINISLGTNGGAHDGTELMSRWINVAMSEPGRSICVAAGNSGQDAPQFDGDVGFWSGRIHASGQIPAAGLRRDIEWVVVGDGIFDISENELEIWYGAQDEFDVELFTPSGYKIGPISAGQRVENLLLKDKTVVSVYNVLSDPKNGDNCISIYLSPYMGTPIVGVGAGTWRVRLIGKVIRDGRYNAWIERDDPSRGRVQSQWRLPSFFGPKTYVDNSTLSSLACGPGVIGVANLDEAAELLHATSSQGPTRDGRQKPEIAAPGTRIVAACGFDPAAQWIEMTGTSMASPYVTGVAALMLSINPNLTSAQIGGIIQRTSQPLPGESYDWNNSAGFGVINCEACLKEVVRISGDVEDLTEKLQATIRRLS